MANPQNLRPPWKPGESGNPGGRPKGRSCAADLRRILDEEAKIKGQSPGHGVANREALLRRLVDDAIKTGNPALYRLILEWHDGRPPDAPPDSEDDATEAPRRIVIPDADDRYSPRTD